MTVTKHYDIDTLPGSFQVTITDNDASQAQVTVLTLADATVDGRTATWQTALPKGHSYTFTESGFSNGSRWSTELTARWLQQVSNTEQAWQDLTVTNFSFVPVSYTHLVPPCPWAASPAPRAVPSWNCTSWRMRFCMR